MAQEKREARVLSDDDNYLGIGGCYPAGHDNDESESESGSESEFEFDLVKEEGRSQEEFTHHEKINFFDLTPRHAKLLTRFLTHEAKNDDEKQFFLHSTNYPVHDDVDEDCMEISFSHPLLKRLRNRDECESRYEVIGKGIINGQSAKSSVCIVLATIALYDNHITIKYGDENWSRIVKFSRQLPHVDKRMTHLHEKQPTIFDDFSATVMRRMQGIDLLTLIEVEQVKTIKGGVRWQTVISPLQRINLTLALLRSYKAQVLDCGIAHRDVKLENVKIDCFDRDDCMPVVSWIDFEDAAVLGELVDDALVGSINSYPPEALIPGAAITKTYDMFSMARLLAVLWHCHDESLYIYDNDDYEEYLLDNNLMISKLFREVGNLSGNTKTKISLTLALMHQTEPEWRLSVDDAIANFEGVRKEYLETLGIDAVNIVYNEVSPGYRKNKEIIFFPLPEPEGHVAHPGRGRSLSI